MSQAGLELELLILPSPIHECWDHRRFPPDLACVVVLLLTRLTPYQLSHTPSLYTNLLFIVQEALRPHSLCLPPGASRLSFCNYCKCRLLREPSLTICPQQQICCPTSPFRPLPRIRRLNVCLDVCLWNSYFPSLGFGSRKTRTF